MLSFFPLDVLDEIWDVIESVSEGFLTYSFNYDVEDSLLYWCSPAYWNMYVFCENATRATEAETVCFCS